MYRKPLPASQCGSLFCHPKGCDDALPKQIASLFAGTANLKLKYVKSKKLNGSVLLFSEFKGSVSFNETRYTIKCLKYCRQLPHSPFRISGKAPGEAHFPEIQRDRIPQRGRPYVGEWRRKRESKAPHLSQHLASGER